MATVTITFNEESEDQDIQDALNGWKWRLVVKDFDGYLRNVVKYDSGILAQKATPQEKKIAEKLRKDLIEMLTDRQLILD
jgi:hypothetical protein